MAPSAATNNPYLQQMYAAAAAAASSPYAAALHQPAATANGLFSLGPAAAAAQNPLAAAQQGQLAAGVANPAAAAAGAGGAAGATGNPLLDAYANQYAALAAAGYNVAAVQQAQQHAALSAAAAQQQQHGHGGQQHAGAASGAGAAVTAASLNGVGSDITAMQQAGEPTFFPARVWLPNRSCCSMIKVPKGFRQDGLILFETKFKEGEGGEEKNAPFLSTLHWVSNFHPQVTVAKVLPHTKDHGDVLFKKPLLQKPSKPQ